MAPEVAAVERKGGYNTLCDIWAVGITAIELAELQPPLFDLHPMRVLVLMSKSSYKPPTLKDKVKWSPTFHDFVKSCLTKNPKKRPMPDRLLAVEDTNFDRSLFKTVQKNFDFFFFQTHAFLQGNLTNRLTRDLLDRVNNPGARVYESIGGEFEDDQPSASNNVLMRIPSQRPLGDRNQERNG